jgi:uncharacterized membrane protein
LTPAPNDAREAPAVHSRGNPASQAKNREGVVLHDAFRTGITIKGIDGILEVIGGVLLWFVKPHSMDRVVRWLFQHELSRDPRDFIATHALHAAGHLTGEGKTFASIYLIAHGIVKIGLVTALWRDKLWAYPLSICVFSIFDVYQLYRFAHTHSLALVVLTVFDAVVIYLTWREYRAQKLMRSR